ncbi:cyanophycinase [Pseudoalteromonas sp. MMG010]|uniref:cyanophycinase n=1 Tax=Pseudoalteromonas sp. MMG010 TaxID=2822685 RepID=UPI001B3A45A7|nr:cyanophycinase [Pseudoalteromonas sp. MMG010]MBQ4834509.1 cyanophycinase [Pseudoalteromonas sp. MMG010]
MPLKVPSFAAQMGRICLFYASVMMTHSANATNAEQTIIVMGTDITTCSNLTPEFCNEQAKFTHEQTEQYKLTQGAIKTLQTHWPSANKNHKQDTVKNLTVLLNSHPQKLTKRELLWAWRDIASFQMSELTEEEFNYVINMLQIPNAITKNTLEVASKHSLSDQTWLNDSIDFIKASLQVKSAKPTLLFITSAQQDPYQPVRYYQSVLAQAGINAQWLALTPALVTALNNGQCENLDTYRNKTMALYNRETVYPEHTRAEYALCKQGVDTLLEQITQSTGVLLLGSNNDNVLRKSLFDKHDNAYPWSQQIANAEVLITTGNSADLLASHQLTKVISNQETPQLKAGLNAFSYGFLTSQFSEQNKTALYTQALNTNKVSRVLGVDDNTSLVVIKSAQGNVLTVLGERGVVYLTTTEQQQYRYSYWPSKTVLQPHASAFKLSKRSIDNALGNIKIPPLPSQRFKNILSDSRLRSLTQAMCLSQEKTTLGQHKNQLVTISATNSTAYYRINSSPYGCAIENLTLNLTNN